MKLSLTILCVAACTASLAHAQEIVVGLITKTDTNPFFVKMKEGAMEAAKAKGAKLMSAARRRWRGVRQDRQEGNRLYRYRRDAHHRQTQVWRRQQGHHVRHERVLGREVVRAIWA